MKIKPDKQNSSIDDIIDALSNALEEVNLSEAWYQNYMNLLIRLEKHDPRSANDFLSQAAAKTKAIISSKDNIDSLFATLAASGACIQPVHGCFVLTDPENAPTPQGFGQPVKPVEITPKTAQIVDALIDKGIFADDMIVYRSSNLSNMRRIAPYTIIDIPRLDRQIAICDQIGEIAFVSHKRLPINIWSKSSKDDLKAMDSVTAYKYSRKLGWADTLVNVAIKDKKGEITYPENTKKITLPKPTKKALPTKEQIVEWMEIYFEKEKRYPFVKDKEIYERDGNDGYQTVEGENWSTIDLALRRGGRGLEAEDLTLLKLKVESGLRSKKLLLTKEQIIEWVEIYFEKEKKYPSIRDTEVYERDTKGGYQIVEDENWSAIDLVLQKGNRGLKAESSLAKLKQENNLVEDKNLTEAQIIEWVEIYFEKENKYPSIKDTEVYERDGKGGYQIVEGENWSLINSVLYKGFRGLEAGSYLAELKQRNNLIEDKILTETQIIEWVEIYFEKEKRYPSAKDKEVYERDGKGGYQIVDNQTWMAIHGALYEGHKGLNPGSSLAELKQENNLVVDNLTKTQIIEWVEIYFEKEKRYPTQHDKEVYEHDDNGGYKIVDNQTWTAIHGALYRGNRGLEPGSSLAELKQEHSLVASKANKSHPRIGNNSEHERINPTPETDEINR